MSYIEKTLISGESVVYRTRLHWIVMAVPIFLGLMLTAAGIGFLLGAARNQGTTGEAMKVFGLILILTAVATVIWGIWHRSSTEMAVTNKRVLVKVGMVSRNTTEMVLAKIESVAVKQSMMGRIFNFGTIIVRGTGGTPEPFAKINHPLEFRKKVQEQLDRLQLGATAGPA